MLEYTVCISPLDRKQRNGIGAQRRGRDHACSGRVGGDSVGGEQA